MKKILFSMLAVLAIICANTSAYAADSGSASTVNRKCMDTLTTTELWQVLTVFVH